MATQAFQSSRTFASLGIALIFASSCATTHSPARSISSDHGASPIRVAVVTAETLKTRSSGGLAAATEGMADELNRVEGISATLYTPGYTNVMTKLGSIGSATRDAHDHRVPVDFDYEGNSYRTVRYRGTTIERANGANIHLFEHQADQGQRNLFDTSDASAPKSEFYGPSATKGEAFLSWNKAVAEDLILKGYDHVILNDWQAGGVAAYLRKIQRERPGVKIPKITFAIHNMAYTEPMPKDLVRYAGLDW